MKNPIIAGVLNFFLPGAGYLYVGGRKKKFGAILLLSFILLYSTAFLGSNVPTNITSNPSQQSSPSVTQSTSQSVTQSTSTTTSSISTSSQTQTSNPLTESITQPLEINLQDNLGTVAAFLLLFGFAYDGYNEALKKR